MRSTLRSLTSGLAAILAGATMAQQPFTLVIDGVVTNCYPGQTVNVQTIQGTQPVWNFDVPVDPNTCTWSATLAVASNPAWYMVSTLCDGMVVSMSDSTGFGAGDSTIVSVTLSCGTFQNLDCNGIENGPDMPGTSCINFFGDTGVWSVDCICELNAEPDCLGDPGGSALPGTFCDDNDNNPNTQGVWNSACICTPDTSSFFYDCLGVLNGLSGPGTLCTYTDDSVTYVGGVFNWACVCVNDSNNFYDCSGDLGGTAFIDGCGVCAGGNTGITPNTTCADCLGVPNGPNMAGTACTIPGTTTEGIWSADCVCEPNTTEPCQADFWVIQAMGPDSLPVPYELWVWNLSSGGSGNFTFNWNFGDGSSSTDAYPTHTYSGNGPYVLCLTIADNNNCTDTHCDTVSINGDGIYEGMVVHHEDRNDGFTINVQNPNANGVEELVGSSIATWPNPAVDELNVAIVSGLKGLVTVTITDMDGRTVKTERMPISGGRSQLRITTGGLNTGMYMLRISDGSMNLSQRFVKTN